MTYVTRTNSKQGEILVLTPTNPNNGPISQDTGYLGLVEYSPAIQQALPGRDQVCEIVSRPANKNVKRSNITALVWLSGDGNGQVGVYLNGRPDSDEAQPDVIMGTREAQVIFGVVPAEGAVQKVAVTRVSDSAALTQAGIDSLNAAAAAAGLDRGLQVPAQPAAQPVAQPAQVAPPIQEENCDDDDDDDDDCDENDTEVYDDGDVPEIVEYRDELRSDVVGDIDDLSDIIDRVKSFIERPSEDTLPGEDDVNEIVALASNIVSNLSAISALNLAANKAGIEEVTQFRPL